MTQQPETTLGVNVAPISTAARAATPLQLFLGFASIGIVGFGGVMPWVRWLLVDKRRWCDEQEFNNLFALANFLPGGNVVSVSVLLGSRMAGLSGAIAAVAGLVGPPAILVCIVGGLYQHYSGTAIAGRILSAMAAAAAGLIMAIGIRMFRPLCRSPRAIVIVLAVAVASAVLRLPLAWTLLALLPTSLIAARFIRN